LIRSLSDRGLISNDTTINICGESTVNYELEKRKRTAEVKEGDEVLMYPKITQNQEDKGTDIQGQKPVAPVVDKTKKVPEDRKKGSPEAKNWTQMKLEGDEEIDESLVIAEDEELELAKWVENRITDKYIRRGQRNPKDFNDKSFRVIWLNEELGIRAIIGKLK